MQSKWFTLGLRIVIGVLGVVFIITGIFNGGMKAVLYKAITICSQCIGIG
ncbi:MAG: thioredoxin [Clostridia bacterium]|nr:thioredoxin [Clostridia bacterium]